MARALALQVRMMTAEQVSRACSGKVTAPQLADDVIGRLERLRLIERRVFEAHPLLRLTRPLYSWNPGEPPPPFEQLEALARTSRERWKTTPAASEVLTATKSAARLFGAFSDAGRAKHCEATHDLHVAEVFLRYQTKQLIADGDWWGEAALPKLGFEVKGLKDPDAFLMDGHGRIRRVIEFAGVYSAEHLANFHAHCAGRAAERLARRFKSLKSPVLSRLYAAGGTSYELW